MEFSQHFSKPATRSLLYFSEREVKQALINMAKNCGYKLSDNPNYYFIQHPNRHSLNNQNLTVLINDVESEDPGIKNV